jgi:hypothetical protein
MTAKTPMATKERMSGGEMIDAPFDAPIAMVKGGR